MKETIVFIIKKMRKYRDVFFKISFCLLLTQAVTLVGPYISGLIVDNFLSGAINIKYISYLIVAGVGLGLFAKLIDIVRERLDVGSFHFDFHQETWMDGFEKMLTLSVGQHANKSSGVKDKIMSKGTNAMRTIIQSIIYDFLPFILKIATTLVALFIIDWHFGLLALGGVFIAGGIQTYILYRYLPDLRHLEILGQQTHKSSWDILRNIYLVKNSGREQHAKEYVDETLVEEYSLSKKIWKRFLIRLTLSESLIPIFTGLIMFLAVLKISQGGLSPGMFVVVTAWSGMFFSEVRTIQRMQRVLAMNVPAVKELKDFLDIKPSIVSNKNPIRPERYYGEVEFRNVTFAYQDDEESESANVLENISFATKPGEFIGVVGKSGSGKSTITKLLLRNYDPQEGQVLIDGNDLRLLDLREFLQSVGYVEQSTDLLDGSIRRNLEFVTSRKLSDEDLKNALRQAGLLDFVENLEKGLETKIGEHGIKLSGGQRQRLAIARALVKKPSLLILDEATASLDSEKEREIQEAIDNLANEDISATKIVIAHRLSTIVKADRIFVFDEGSLVAVGNHLELLNSCDIYKNLYSIQHNTEVA